MAPDNPFPSRVRGVYWPPLRRETELLQFTGFSRLGNGTVTSHATTAPIVPLMVELLCALVAAALATRWLAAASATLGIPSLLVGAVTALL
jgi:hypothetical protein